MQASNCEAPSCGGPSLLRHGWRVPATFSDSSPWWPCPCTNLPSQQCNQSVWRLWEGPQGRACSGGRRNVVGSLTARLLPAQ